ncbi:CIC11C00000000597 [Sungouiella intermedia]|uniref:Lysyl-tRNA synthetase n=1 Tax=Sungouiella intermedia TaxID=45354 RepID=A0A1L0BLN8_9ASCO|nr:CIC11C00000000597 [[Candida] intermedia]
MFWKTLRQGPKWTSANAKNVLIRFSSTDEFNYLHRKELISRSPQSYYPTISSVRSSAPVLRIPDFIRSYGLIDFKKYENKRHTDLVQVEGRVKSIRRAGKAMYFIDIVQDETKLQLCASNKLLTGMSSHEFSRIHAFIRKGDHIVCVGHPSTTNVGELTVKAMEPIKVTSPCLNSVTLPDKISDRKLINSHRVLNYLVDVDLKQKILVKSAVTGAIRDFLVSADFVEVQTPIIAGAGTGANAEPFITSLRALSDEKLLLRVAPELWLKKLVIGGFDKVFEIGMNFRNEGIDATHNPEFQTCEFYQSFTSLSQLMKITEDMFAFIYDVLDKKSDKLQILRPQIKKLKAFGAGDFPRYEFIPMMEEKTGRKMPDVLDTENLLEFYKQINLEPPSTKSPAALLDNLSGIFLESISEETPDVPIFIYNQPSVMSPLAKSSIVEYGERSFDVSLRFELFINGKEYVNSYEEENSPYAQAEKFALQQQTKADFKDNEALIPDWFYVQQMEYGLPPTGGWGCGIDRLSMLFSGSERIEDVLTFGTLRDAIRQ